ncbi:MAG: kinase/pyrophosphorylase, partial [Alphaproteobacteria bacterium]|nr:kinase/pyrophosphorylase [Alphaproteobacteria bacterium]MCK5658556.1 kinase/pyrophosphorylase [Alphaproteobacteria bacterium]
MSTFHLHLISDSTGGTLNSVVKACLAQFDVIHVEQYFWPLVRTQKQLQNVFEKIHENPGLVLYTIVDDGLAQVLEKHCQAIGVPALSILHPVLELMSGYFGKESLAEPGLQHRLNAEYFARMNAVDYALHHDDGQKSDQNLDHADVILVGVSRTSKTPTCIYLANHGIKAANIPYVPGIPFPKHILELKNPMFVAMTATPARLIEVRRNRLQNLGEHRETDYLESDKVQEETRESRRFYTSHGWPVIDVTRRSIEETATEILSMLNSHHKK